MGLLYLKNLEKSHHLQFASASLSAQLCPGLVFGGLRTWNIILLAPKSVTLCQFRVARYHVNKKIHLIQLPSYWPRSFAIGMCWKLKMKDVRGISFSVEGKDDHCQKYFRRLGFPCRDQLSLKWALSQPRCVSQKGFSPKCHWLYPTI